jgi:hypothetical protein
VIPATRARPYPDLPQLSSSGVGALSFAAGGRTRREAVPTRSWPLPASPTRVVALDREAFSFFSTLAWQLKQPKAWFNLAGLFKMSGGWRIAGSLPRRLFGRCKKSVACSRDGRDDCNNVDS